MLLLFILRGDRKGTADENNIIPDAHDVFPRDAAAIPFGQGEKGYRPRDDEGTDLANHGIEFQIADIAQPSAVLHADHFLVSKLGVVTAHSISFVLGK